VRIYTRTGDEGETGLLGEMRVRKDALRIEAVGGLDEVNAAIGLAAAAVPDAWVRDCLVHVQRDLFALGAWLADVRPPARVGDKARLPEDAVPALEAMIDRADTALPRLTRFILPGGSEAGARLHLARSVCRRAERRMVALAGEAIVPPPALAYVNRLSDFLFVLARVLNRRAGVAESEW